MGDANHLERMGRELKCPICLSLLCSAVSLSCNHVFCNSCIVSSMKSGCACPVCKVPYRRREVRPAPHMDNLVSIYKSMEVASGINIFVTQNTSSTKLSDVEKQAAGDDNQGEHDTGGNCEDIKNKQNSLKVFTSNTKNTAKPSFPAKKRVQVPKCPFSETPTRLAQFEHELCEIAKEEPNSAIIKKPVPSEKGEPVLSPFFWLRDKEEVEKSSQQTDEDQLMDMLLDIPPVNVPAFSDMKDSDDEYPPTLTPTGGLHGKCSHFTDFDSEMFEWTQRPCSPELCSSPSKRQVANVEEINKIQENKLEAGLPGVTRNDDLRSENSRCQNSKRGSGTEDIVLPNGATCRTKGRNNQNGGNKSNKSGRIRKASERAQKCTKRHTDSDFGIYIDLNVVSENFIQEQNSYNNGSMGKTSIWGKKIDYGTSAAKPTTENAHPVSLDTETLSRENVVTETSPSFGEKEGSDKDYTMKKAGKRQKKINCSVRSGNRKLDSEKDNMLEEVFSIQKRKSEDAIPLLSPSSISMAENKKASDDTHKPSKHVKESMSSDRELRSKNKLKVSSDFVNDIQGTYTCVPASEIQLNEKIQGKSDFKVQDDTSVMPNLPSAINEAVLQKCETISYKFQCAFCLSSEESEASGEMVHYYNSRPAPADHNGGFKVVHVHRNCTEWAPNVYFEDDIVINLEDELTRSRRIKCCCCGNKGAALGCYEKSCRKSFHVPCAKSMPQCRWDSDNFVMLCPLHLSSKLPSESAGSQERSKKCTPKRKLSQRDFVASKHEISISRNFNFSVSSKKLILCCSALTTPDWVTVSDFERLFGVTVLKKWDSSVTHVIGSTDENRACRRTLKILMGILEGKWILSIEWIKACMKVMQLVDEEPYEISVDVHGIRDGPRLGRLRLLNKQAKLFNGCKFYFMGDFTPSYKGYLQDLVIAAGGTILHRKPITDDPNASVFQTFIVYSLELPEKCNPSKKAMILNRRRSDADALAGLTGAKLASNSWVLNSIAACNLQNLPE